MKKINKKSLKQQGGQSVNPQEQQMMQQQQIAQQQQQDPTTELAASFSEMVESGYEPKQVIMQFIEYEVPEELIYQTLLKVGYSENDVQALFTQVSEEAQQASNEQRSMMQPQQQPQQQMQQAQDLGEIKDGVYYTDDEALLSKGRDSSTYRDLYEKKLDLFGEMSSKDAVGKTVTTPTSVNPFILTDANKKSALNQKWDYDTKMFADFYGGNRGNPLTQAEWEKTNSDKKALELINYYKSKGIPDSQIHYSTLSPFTGSGMKGMSASGSYFDKQGNISPIYAKPHYKYERKTPRTIHEYMKREVPDEDRSKEGRKKLAEELGIEDYDYSEEKNTELLEKYKAFREKPVVEEEKEIIKPVDRTRRELPRVYNFSKSTLEKYNRAKDKDAYKQKLENQIRFGSGMPLIKGQYGIEQDEGIISNRGARVRNWMSQIDPSAGYNRGDVLSKGLRLAKTLGDTFKPKYSFSQGMNPFSKKDKDGDGFADGWFMDSKKKNLLKKNLRQRDKNIRKLQGRSIKIHDNDPNNYRFNSMGELVTTQQYDDDVAKYSTAQFVSPTNSYKGYAYDSNPTPYMTPQQKNEYLQHKQEFGTVGDFWKDPVTGKSKKPKKQQKSTWHYMDFLKDYKYGGDLDKYQIQGETLPPSPLEPITFEDWYKSKGAGALMNVPQNELNALYKKETGYDAGSPAIDSDGTKPWTSPEFMPPTVTDPNKSKRTWNQIGNVAGKVGEIAYQGADFFNEAAKAWQDLAKPTYTADNLYNITQNPKNKRGFVDSNSRILQENQRVVYGPGVAQRGGSLPSYQLKGSVNQNIFNPDIYGQKILGNTPIDYRDPKLAAMLSAMQAQNRGSSGGVTGISNTPKKLPRSFVPASESTSTQRPIILTDQELKNKAWRENVYPTLSPERKKQFDDYEAQKKKERSTFASRLMEAPGVFLDNTFGTSADPNVVAPTVIPTDPRFYDQVFQGMNMATTIPAYINSYADYISGKRKEPMDWRRMFPTGYQQGLFDIENPEQLNIINSLHNNPDYTKNNPFKSFAQEMGLGFLGFPGKLGKKVTGKLAKGSKGVAKNVSKDFTEEFVPADEIAEMKALLKSMNDDPSFKEISEATDMESMSKAYRNLNQKEIDELRQKADDWIKKTDDDAIISQEKFDKNWYDQESKGLVRSIEKDKEYGSDSAMGWAEKYTPEELKKRGKVDQFSDWLAKKESMHRSSKARKNITKQERKLLEDEGYPKGMTDDQVWAAIQKKKQDYLQLGMTRKDVRAYEWDLDKGRVNYEIDPNYKQWFEKSVAEQEQDVWDEALKKWRSPYDPQTGNIKDDLQINKLGDKMNIEDFEEWLNYMQNFKQQGGMIRKTQNRNLDKYQGKNKSEVLATGDIPQIQQDNTRVNQISEADMQAYVNMMNTARDEETFFKYFPYYKNMENKPVRDPALQDRDTNVVIKDNMVYHPKYATKYREGEEGSGDNRGLVKEFLDPKRKSIRSMIPYFEVGSDPESVSLMRKFKNSNIPFDFGNALPYGYMDVEEYLENVSPVGPRKKYGGGHLDKYQGIARSEVKYKKNPRLYNWSNLEEKQAYYDHWPNVFAQEEERNQRRLLNDPEFRFTEGQDLGIDYRVDSPDKRYGDRPLSNFMAFYNQQGNRMFREKAIPNAKMLREFVQTAGSDAGTPESMARQRAWLDQNYPNLDARNTRFLRRQRGGNIDYGNYMPVDMYGHQNAFSTFGRPVYQYGGQTTNIVEVDDRMIQKLIAAGADIEYL
jgi:hypothetical protein